MVGIFNESDMYNLKFHEDGQLADNNNVHVLRVIGGWTYTITQHGMIGTVFVPFVPQVLPIVKSTLRDTTGGKP